MKLKDVSQQLRRAGYSIPAAMVETGNVDQAIAHMVDRGRPDIGEWIDSLLSGDLFGSEPETLSDVESRAHRDGIETRRGGSAPIDDLPLFGAPIQGALAL